MVLTGNADHRIGTAAQLARDDHAEDARHIGAERHDLQIEHQLGVRFEGIRNADGPLRQFQRRLVVLLFGALDAQFHVANRIEILAQFGPVAIAEARSQAACLASHRIQNASALLFTRKPLRACCRHRRTDARNTTRGLFSIMFGVVSLRQETVLT